MIQIKAQNLSLGYGQKGVLKDVNLSIQKGEFITIIGPSGVGKSTLLMAINASTAILRGELFVLGEALHSISGQGLKRLRSRIGVIFQGYNLVKRLSVLDNVASGMLQQVSLFPAMLKYYTSNQYRKIYDCMKIVSLEQEALKRCDRLSGGQMQRVAIARALAQEPEIILADEPISSLDPVSAKKVMETLREVNRNYGISIVSNLHQLNYAKEYCTRVVGLHNGQIVFDGSPDLLTQEVVDHIYHGERREQDECLPDGLPFLPEVIVA
jgi:phosphonate transport system ATP-binding protein